MKPVAPSVLDLLVQIGVENDEPAIRGRRRHAEGYRQASWTHLTHDTYMKLRHFATAVLCALVVGSAAPVQAQAPKTPLAQNMKKLNSAYKALGRAIRAGTAPEALTQVAIIRDQAEASLKLQPARKSEIPDGEQSKFVADYKSTMEAFLVDVKKLEAALKAGNMDEAKTLNTALKTDQTKAHKQFKKAGKDDSLSVSIRQ